MHLPSAFAIRASMTTLCGIAMLGSSISIRAEESSPVLNNPISKLARLINPKLEQVEDRVNWLKREMASLAIYQQYHLDTSIGFRGHRPTPDSPDPSITLDLGEAYPIDAIFLIPCQKLNLADKGIFPVSFTIEIADTPDFSDAIQIEGDRPQHATHNGYPHPIGVDQVGRYVRLKVSQGHSQISNDQFGLSELFVFSGNEPVSFQATVTTQGDLNTDQIWHPGALIDGRSPLGIWHNGKSSEEQLGEALIVQSENTQASWSVKLSKEHLIDRVVLFPYQMGPNPDISILPQSFRIEIKGPKQPQPKIIYDWKSPVTGANCMTPFVIPLNGVHADEVTVVATTPWAMGDRKMHALSEIQIWSAGSNIALHQPVTRTHHGESSEITSLTDGFSSKRTIAPIKIWLKQLNQRMQIKQELASLNTLHTQLSTSTELNVSWGAAVILGMTFLYPVFIFERRRIRSKEHLDMIRKRIAADLHDDIGSNLGSISLIARTVRKDLAKANVASELDSDLGEVETIARESSLAMRDIVWLLERKQDSIGDLVHRMRETAGRLLRGIDFNLECSSTKTAAKITLDAKRHLFLFYKEAIHNIVKHSKADHVSIKLWDEGEQLGMEIVDNGVGLPVNDDHASVNVRKLEERAEVLGGKLHMTSSSKDGTCIRLLVKRITLTNQKALS